MIQPSSLEVRLDKYCRVSENPGTPTSTRRLSSCAHPRGVVPEADERLILHPGEFVLGSTYETCTLPDDVAGRLEGKSSPGRLGLLTHSTAGSSTRGSPATPR